MKIEKDALVIATASLPPAIAAAYGTGWGSLAAGAVALAHIALEDFQKRNKVWWESYLEASEVVDLIDERMTSPEYWQYLREVLRQTAFETREEKRKALLCAAINNLHQTQPFDQQMKYLSVLDQLSADEVRAVLEMCSMIDPDGVDTRDIGEMWGAYQLNLHQHGSRLTSLGLLDLDVYNEHLPVGGTAPRMVRSLTTFGRQFAEWIYYDGLEKYYSQNNPSSSQ